MAVSISVLDAFKHTTVATLSTVGAAASSITHAANSVSALTETAAAHAQAYRDDSIEEIETNGAKRRYLRVQLASISLAEDLRALEKRLAADPELAEVYSKIDQKLFDNKPRNPA